MPRIILLDELTANQIAAGEVVERPASVVKELVENSIDAGATIIRVDIRGGGIKYIRVSDNGCGIPAEDVEMAFERHATSKIRSARDLEEGIVTNGFRGEALASIASVANVEMVTRTEDSEAGVKVAISGGDILSVAPQGAPVGTTVTVKDLFFNTPARYKFLKKDIYEGASVSEFLSRLALAHPEVAISLYSGGEKQFATTGKGDLREAIYTVFGGEIARHLYRVDYTEGGVAVTGFVGDPSIARGNRANEIFFCNGRLFRSRVMTVALEMGYGTRLMKKQFPFACLNIRVSPWAVDVNVHPQKTEIRFAEENKVADALRHAVAEALDGQRQMTEALKPERRGGFVPEQPTEIQETLEVSTSAQVKPADYIAETAPQPPVVTETPKAQVPPVPERVYTPPEPQKAPEETFEPEKHTETHVSTNNDKKADFEGLEYIGTLWDTYLVFQKGASAVIIDQHAAHERVRFEELLAEFRRGEVEEQQMLIPIVVTLTATEYASVFEYTEEFRQVGVTFDDYGRNTVAIRSIPGIAEPEGFAEAFVYMLDQLRGGIRITAKPETFLYKIACTGAVKANQRLTRQEIDRLLEDLARLENPYNCPHGRPTAIRMTTADMEKMFRRIV